MFKTILTVGLYIPSPNPEYIRPAILAKFYIIFHHLPKDLAGMLCAVYSLNDDMVMI